MGDQPIPLARVATEARARTVSQWIAERTGDPRQKYCPPTRKGPQAQAPLTNTEVGGSESPCAPSFSPIAFKGA